MTSRGPIACILGALVSVWLLCSCDAEVNKTTPRQQPTIVIVPSTATMRARETLEFHAFVTDTAGPVTWSVEITSGTLREQNEISPNHFSSLFGSPVTGGVYSILVSTPTTSATATVTVLPLSCRKQSAATSLNPGMDGIWANDDDDYFPFVRYSYSDDIVSLVSYKDPGIDRRWGTSDDVVVLYGTAFMTKMVEFEETYVAGADGIWFTADDLKVVIRMTDWGPRGKPHPTSIYPYISMYDPDGIKPWLSTDRISSGDDGQFETSDDFHIVTQNYRDSHGRLLRQESFRGIENQFAKYSNTQFLIDVASKSSTQIVQEKGKDNLFGTADDFEEATNIFHFTDDSFSKVDYSEALWYLDPSLVMSIDKYDYDPWGKLTNIVRLTYEGDDREWLTPDDLISEYTLFLYDEYGIWSSRITYEDPGPDREWMTEDDVVSEFKMQTHECEE